MRHLIVALLVGIVLESGVARAERPDDLGALVAAGEHWRLETARGPVHVWIPAGYDPATAAAVVYVHGYFVDVDTAWSSHRLPEQFALSGINAMFIAPEAPAGKHDRIVWPTLTSLLLSVQLRVPVAMPDGEVAVIGHSGAYRTLLQWVHDRQLETLVLLDAAYVDILPYRSWVLGNKRRRLINVSEDTRPWAERLHRMLPASAVLDGFPESAEAIRDERIVYIRSQIGHWPLAKDGVALPLLLRALEAPRVMAHELPLGLPPIDTFGLPLLDEG